MKPVILAPNGLAPSKTVKMIECFDGDENDDPDVQITAIYVAQPSCPSDAIASPQQIGLAKEKVRLAALAALAVTPPEKICAICLALILPSKLLVLKCSHGFHAPCINEWREFQRKAGAKTPCCPECRGVDLLTS